MLRDDPYRTISILSTFSLIHKFVGFVVSRILVSFITSSCYSNFLFYFLQPGRRRREIRNFVTVAKKPPPWSHSRPHSRHRTPSTRTVRVEEEAKTATGIIIIIVTTTEILVVVVVDLEHHFILVHLLVPTTILVSQHLRTVEVVVDMEHHFQDKEHILFTDLQATIPHLFHQDHPLLDKEGIIPITFHHLDLVIILKVDQEEEVQDHISMDLPVVHLLSDLHIPVLEV